MVPCESARLSSEGVEDCVWRWDRLSTAVVLQHAWLYDRAASMQWGLSLSICVGHLYLSNRA